MSDKSDAATVLIWRSGLDKGCDWFNQAWLDFTGRSLAEEVGSGWTQGVHPDDLEACLATYNEAFDARRPFRMTYRLQRRDGVYRWVLDIGKPYARDGAFAGYYGTCIDVTEQRASRQETADQLGRRDVTSGDRNALLAQTMERVSANLQNLRGLIDQHQDAITGPAEQRTSLKVAGLVQTLAAIKTRLLQARDASRISAQDLLAGICAEVAAQRDRRDVVVTFRIDAEAADLPMERAIVIGLLASELIEDAAQRLREIGGSVEVSVRFRWEADVSVLEIAHELPPNTSLGQGQIASIDALARSLGGRLETAIDERRVVRLLEL